MLIPVALAICVGVCPCIRSSLIVFICCKRMVLFSIPMGGLNLYDLGPWATARGLAYEKSEFKRVINPYSKEGKSGEAQENA